MAIFRNSIWTLSSYILPTIISLFSIGLLARLLGTAEFGIYMLIMAIIGYSGIFEAGLNRSVIREVSIYSDDKGEIVKIISCSTYCAFVLGLIGATLLFILSSLIVRVLGIALSELEVVTDSIRLLSLVIPILLITIIWSAILEGKKKFKTLAIKNSISNSMIAILPVLIIYVTDGGIFEGAIGILLARVIGLLVTIYFVKDELAGLKVKFHRNVFERFINYGSWLAISNIISPIMVYFDKFILSYLKGAGVVAYYTAPAELIQKMSIIPSSISRAIFPSLSEAKTKELEKNIKNQAIKIILPIILFVVIGVYLFSEVIIELWLGVEYVAMSSRILVILSIGFAFNALAYIDFTYLQAKGKSKTTAYLHMIELLPYLLLLYCMINWLGVIGAAYAWSIRMVVDFFILKYISSRLEF